jgi:hypothetical protein
MSEQQTWNGVPCHTPADLAAAVQAERDACAAGLDAAAAMLRLRDAEDRGIPHHMGHSFEANAAEAWAKMIRARGDTSALDAAIKAAEARGMERAAALIMPKNEPNDWTEYAHIRADAAAAIRAGVEEAKGDAK